MATEPFVHRGAGRVEPGDEGDLVAEADHQEQLVALREQVQTAEGFASDLRREISRQKRR